jgi:hypothetical protein
MWTITVEKKQELLCDLLELGLMSIKNGLNRYKALLFYWPEICTLIGTKAKLSAEEQYQVLKFLIKLVKDKLLLGKDIILILSDGFPTVLKVFSTAKELQMVCKLITEKFEVNQNYSMLMTLKFSFDFMHSNFGIKVLHF